MSGVSIVPPQRADVDSSFSGNSYWLRAATCLAFISAATKFVGISLENPHGQWDAWATWNLRARFLYRGGSNWTHFTLHYNANTDYPLLIPASIARSWEFIGKETQVIPIVIAFLFTFSMIGLVSISISRFRGKRQGLLAGLILFGTPFLIAHGASQYADVPLSFFFLAAVVLLLLYAESPLRRNFLILGGIASGLSAWTKNEGILFSGAFLLSYCLVTTVSKGSRYCRSEVLTWLVGIAPVFLVIALYKFSVAGSNDVVSAHGLVSNVHNLLDLSRYRLVMAQFAKELFTFGGWIPAFSMPVLMLFYFLLLGPSIQKNFLHATMVSLSLPILMMIGHFCVYMVSPYDLNWHLQTSLHRLLLQVWPLAIVAYFMTVRTPELAVMPDPLQNLNIEH